MSNIILMKNRYLVPFMFDINQTNSFDNLIKTIETSHNWTLSTPYDEKTSDGKEIEHDLYSTLLDCFIMDKNQCNIGCEFLYSAYDKTDEPILSFNYTKFKKDFLVTINKMGLHLFRTGVGFIWYEISIPQNTTISEMILFQNEFKELTYERFIIPNKKTQRYTFELCPNQDQGLLLGDWLNSQLSKLPLKYTYFAFRKSPTNANSKIPDKALIYTYGLFENIQKEDLLEHLYHITNGYNEKYKVPPLFSDSVIEPFANAFYYSSMNSTGYFVISNSSNKNFYQGNFADRIMCDYFRMYILALYQSYSLLKFTNDMESKLAAEYTQYLKNSQENLEILEKVETEINVFLIKGIYSSVSHITHQNDYYHHLAKKQKIRENIDGLTIGLESLHKLQAVREKERLEYIERTKNQEKEELNDRINIGLSIISMFALLSAIVDGQEVISLICALFGFSAVTKRIFELLGLIGIIFIAIIVGINLLNSRIHRKHSK